MYSTVEFRCAVLLDFCCKTTHAIILCTYSPSASGFRGDHDKMISFVGAAGLSHGKCVLWTTISDADGPENKGLHRPDLPVFVQGRPH